MLQNLDLSSNKLTQVPNSFFQFLKSLKTLNMSGNPVIKLSDLQFIELHSTLVTLELNNLRHLSSISKFAFGGLVQLKVSDYALCVRSNVFPVELY